MRDIKIHLTKPLTPRELEHIQICAEFEAVGIIGKDPEKEVQRLAVDVLKLCSEIKRLRYTYGEPWWIPVDKNHDDIAIERKTYEDTRNG